LGFSAERDCWVTASGWVADGRHPEMAVERVTRGGQDPVGLD
jgi:hypothetical protein